jgi:acyl phosphate:glycerol-3-phosphate acyltransferase
MEMAVRAAIALVSAYLIGAIPHAVIIGRLFYRIDVREHGSGNAGATNVMRVLGTKAGIAVLVLDVAKGVVAVLVAGLAFPDSLGVVAQDWVLIGAFFTAVLGHSYSPYIGFTGGKGVAPAAGALLVLTPLAWPVLFITFVAVSAISRMVSLGSVITAAEFPVLVLLLYPDRPALITFSFVAAALVIWRHRSNISRILRGEEAKIGVGRSHSDQDRGDAR